MTLHYLVKPLPVTIFFWGGACWLNKSRDTGAARWEDDPVLLDSGAMTCGKVCRSIGTLKNRRVALPCDSFRVFLISRNVMFFTNSNRENCMRTDVWDSDIGRVGTSRCFISRTLPVIWTSTWQGLSSDGFIKCYHSTGGSFFACFDRSSRKVIAHRWIIFSLSWSSPFVLGWSLLFRSSVTRLTV